MTQALVIIPTYNEKENIQPIVKSILAQNLGFHILVVDDNSPDGTAKLVEAMMSEYPGQVHLLLRQKKRRSR